MAHLVAGGEDRLEAVGPLVRHPSGHEEGRLDILLVEQVDDARQASPRPIRAQRERRRPFGDTPYAPDLVVEDFSALAAALAG